MLDYVHEEILAPQPPQVQQFLLRIAVLHRINAALGAALTDSPDSQALLEYLERHHLFVVPLDGQHRWYRLHDLFRELMLARLQATAPTLVPELHRRAARWYAAAGELHEAIAHAFAAGDVAEAAALVEVAAPRLWRQGEAHRVHAWVQALPDATLLAHTRLALDAILHLLQALHAQITPAFAGGLAAVERTIAGAARPC